MLLTAPSSLTFLTSWVSATCLHKHQVAGQIVLCVRLLDHKLLIKMDLAAKYIYLITLISLATFSKSCMKSVLSRDLSTFPQSVPPFSSQCLSVCDLSWAQLLSRATPVLRFRLSSNHSSFTEPRSSKHTWPDCPVSYVGRSLGSSLVSFF